MYPFDLLRQSPGINLRCWLFLEFTLVQCYKYFHVERNLNFIKLQSKCELDVYHLHQFIGFCMISTAYQYCIELRQRHLVLPLATARRQPTTS